MALTQQAGDPSSYPATVEGGANGDGTSSFWANTFAPLLNRTAWLKANLTAAGATIGAYSGASFIIASGSIETFLRLLANKAAKLDATSQIFAGDQHLAQTKSLVADGTGCSLGGDWNTPSGSTLTCASGGAWNVASGGLLSVSSGGTLSCLAGSTSTLAGTVNATSASTVSLLGRVVPRSARVPVADAASKVLGVAAGSGVDYAGKRFQLSATASTGPNVIKLKSTGVVPAEGETIECVWYSGTPGTAAYAFKREDNTVIASFTWSADPLFPFAFCWAEFEFVSGVWRLGGNSGQAVDAAGPAAFGVIPGTGA